MLGWNSTSNNSLPSQAFGQFSQSLRTRPSASSLYIQGFKASEALVKLAARYEDLSEEERREQIHKTNTVFELHVSEPTGQADNPEAIWTVDLKRACTVMLGAAPSPGPDVTLRMSDNTFCQLAEGRLDGRKAFFSGRLRMQGDLLRAPKFGGVFVNAFGGGGYAKL